VFSIENKATIVVLKTGERRFCVCVLPRTRIDHLLKYDCPQESVAEHLYFFDCDNWGARFLLHDSDFPNLTFQVGSEFRMVGQWGDKLDWLHELKFLFAFGMITLRSSVNLSSLISDPAEVHDTISPVLTDFDSALCVGSL
jgi:hypothetical protein